MRKVGEDVTEVLVYVPGCFEVVRHVRPAYSCAKCEAMAQAPMPDLPIPRTMAGASVVADVLMSKYADHLPLYRQAEIYARDGLDLDRGLLADWVGKAAWLLRPLAERIGQHVMAGSVIHADDTPVPVLARPATARPGRAGSGSTCATSARTQARRHLLFSTATHRTEKASAAASISAPSEAIFMPTATPASPSFTKVRATRRPV